MNIERYLSNKEPFRMRSFKKDRSFELKGGAASVNLGEKLSVAPFEVFLRHFCKLIASSHVSLRIVLS